MRRYRTLNQMWGDTLVVEDRFVARTLSLGLEPFVNSAEQLKYRGRLMKGWLVLRARHTRRDMGWRNS